VSAEQGAAIARVKGWLLERKPELGDIAYDLDLIEHRVIDSLVFLEFLYFVEELAGRELPDMAAAMQSFRTLQSIQRDIFDVANPAG
jgi:acyl carrier protein